MERISQIFSFNEAKPLIFTQLDFWLFFLVVMILFSFLHKNTLVRSIFLTVVSIFFYFKTSGLYVLLLGFSLLFNYGMGAWIGKQTKDVAQKWIIGVSVFLNVALLGYFKYAYFFTDSFNELFHTDFQVVNQFALWGNGFFGEGSFVDKIILPVGVSFFTFQSISYVVDIYRKEIKPLNNFFDYTFFVTFFPQLVAGPIVRARDFIPQIHNPFVLTKPDFSWAIIQIVKGLIKKLVLADYIAIHFIDKVVEAPEAYPGFVSVVAMWGYSLQIYGDFSGYTDIAIGLSKLMGFDLLENFKSPYKAINVGDFWRRWHKSLGSWLRDYLYIPLGGNKSGGIGTYISISIIFVFLIFITQWYELIFVYIGMLAIYGIGVLVIPNFKTYIHRDLNLLITMIVGGLWHGASENFVIWGAMNGSALVLFNYWKKISPYEKSTFWLVHFWKILLTFNFITFTRIWFRLEDEGAPMAMLHHIQTNFQFSPEAFGKMIWSFLPVMIILLVGYIIHWLPERFKDWYTDTFTKMHIALQVLAVVVIVILIYQAVSDVSKPFVYFQF
jgi:D-alanyl-lipoteichoic acid acyltransferase DltB (MBOAT superfamily)